MTTTTIDCQTCPVRGRHCGDCFVPVLGRVWLDGPHRPTDASARSAGPLDALGDLVGEPTGLPLDPDELAAVNAFVRAGLVHPQEAARARAEERSRTRAAAG